VGSRQAREVDNGTLVGLVSVARCHGLRVGRPVIIAVMLAALDVREGHRVLEVGTGTGYNAALLAHRLGAEQVISVEDRSRHSLPRQEGAV
jgi:protein-L-isoaspartate O-methyltransferase